MSGSRVWHVLPGRESEPGVVYAGVEPAALFRSEDGGDSWTDVPALTKHPTRDRWQPGAGGLILHSIVLDEQRPERMWIGISAAGVFRTDDAGETWEPTNRNIRADFSPDRFPELGQCTHKLLAGAGESGLLYQQNHCGVYRSDDGADWWQDISEGLPSRWGLPLALHPRDPNTLYVLPEDNALGDDVGGGRRYVTDGLFRVFRSRDGGDDWEPLTRGLPDRKVYLHCLREGMTTDGARSGRGLRRNDQRPGLLQQGRGRQLGPVDRQPSPHKLSRRCDVGLNGTSSTAAERDGRSTRERKGARWNSEHSRSAWP